MFTPFLKEAFSAYMMRNIIATVQNVGYARLFGQPLSSTSRFFYLRICSVDSHHTKW
ncbi:hypothetical protein [Metasolibacillus sp. FSL K6-0083]|uniref:hypothetical protein n=1 Tax=Metasolibacillus sp. FSL K6-0083 TaxID=2921416 RepID=UPI00315B2888